HQEFPDLPLRLVAPPGLHLDLDPPARSALDLFFTNAAHSENPLLLLVRGRYSFPLVFNPGADRRQRIDGSMPGLGQRLARADNQKRQHEDETAMEWHDGSFSCC